MPLQRSANESMTLRRSFCFSRHSRYFSLLQVLFKQCHYLRRNVFFVATFPLLSADPHGSVHCLDATSLRICLPADFADPLSRARHTPPSCITCRLIAYATLTAFAILARQSRFVSAPRKKPGVRQCHRGKSDYAGTSLQLVST